MESAPVIKPLTYVSLKRDSSESMFSRENFPKLLTSKITKFYLSFCFFLLLLLLSVVG